MADLKITELTAIDAPIATDIFPLVDDPGGTPATKKSTFQQLADFLASLTQTLTNKTLTSPVIGAITNTDHITITPGTSKLVKIAVLEQAVTTNAYNNNSIILTGWGYATSSGSARYLDTAVTFGITFSTRPIVVSNAIGHKSGSNPSHIGDFGVDVDVTTLGGISTTGFSIRTYRAYDTANLTNGDRTGFSWIAIGTLT